MSEKEIIVVEGNNVLSGEVRVSGAKNSALKLIAASLLGQGASTLHNVPLISDIVVMSEVLECLGATVERDGHTMVIDTAQVTSHETPYELVSKMRVHQRARSAGGAFRPGARGHARRLPDRCPQDRYAPGGP